MVLRRLLDYSITPNFELSPYDDNELIMTLSASDKEEMIERMANALKEIARDLGGAEQSRSEKFEHSPSVLQDTAHSTNLGRFVRSQAYNPFAEDFKTWPRIAQVVLPENYQESP